MENPRLRRLKSLFGRTNDAQQSPAPDAQEPQAWAVTPKPAQADTTPNVPCQEISRPQAQSESQPRLSEQLQSQAVKKLLASSQ